MWKFASKLYGGLGSKTILVFGRRERIRAAIVLFYAT